MQTILGRFIHHALDSATLVTRVTALLRPWRRDAQRRTYTQTRNKNARKPVESGTPDFSGRDLHVIGLLTSVCVAVSGGRWRRW